MLKVAFIKPDDLSFVITFIVNSRQMTTWLKAIYFWKTMWVSAFINVVFRRIGKSVEELIIKVIGNEKNVIEINYFQSGKK